RAPAPHGNHWRLPWIAVWLSAFKHKMLSFGTQTGLLPYIVTMLRSNYAKPSSSCIIEGHVSIIDSLIFTAAIIRRPEVSRKTACTTQYRGNSTEIWSQTSNDTPTGGVGRRSKSRTTWRARRACDGSAVAT